VFRWSDSGLQLIPVDGLEEEDFVLWDQIRKLHFSRESIQRIRIAGVVLDLSQFTVQQLHEHLMNVANAADDPDVKKGRISVFALRTAIDEISRVSKNREKQAQATFARQYLKFLFGSLLLSSTH